MELICASICYRGYAEDEVQATLEHAPQVGYRWMEVHGPLTWSLEAIQQFDLPALQVRIRASGMACAGIYTPGWGGQDDGDMIPEFELAAVCDIDLVMVDVEAEMDGLLADGILLGQARFWSERWQKLEQKAKADLEEGRAVVFCNLRQALDTPDRIDSVKGLRAGQAGDSMGKRGTNKTMRNKSGLPGAMGEAGERGFEGVGVARRSAARSRRGHEKILARMFWIGKRKSRVIAFERFYTRLNVISTEGSVGRILPAKSLESRSFLCLRRH